MPPAIRASARSSSVTSVLESWSRLRPSRSRGERPPAGGTVRRAAAAAVAALAGAGTLALSGCGGSERAGYRIPGRTLTIYTSVPLHGASAVTGLSVLHAEQMALAAAGERIGRY